MSKAGGERGFVIRDEPEMATPVSIEVELSDFVNLAEKAEECAQDLIAEVDARYQDDSPTSARRRERDSAVGRWIFGAVAAYRIKYDVF